MDLTSRFAPKSPQSNQTIATIRLTLRYVPPYASAMEKSNALPDTAQPQEQVRIISAETNREMALQDLWAGIAMPHVWWQFAVHDIKQRFRRSTFGPFWITLSMGIMVFALGSVFGQVFHQDITKFIPYVATGLIFWGLVNSVITEGCTTFIAAEGHIKNIPLPLSVHFLRVFARNLVIFGHNLVIYVVVFALFIRMLGFEMLLVIPGFVLFAAVSFQLGLISAIVSTRYRDIPQILTSLLQVAFLVTPIFWSIEAMPNRPSFLSFNPFFHMMNLVRDPLLGMVPPLQSWLIVVAIMLALIPVTIWLYIRAYVRIPYWV